MAPPAVTGEGLVEVKVIVWLPLLTVIDCWTWGAAFQLVLPAWLASILQVPTPVKLMTPAFKVHPVLVPSRVMVTASPEVAVAVGV